MLHFNISPLFTQQLQIAYKLNLVMFDVIKFFAPAYAAMLRLLSLHVKPRVCKQNLEIKSKKKKVMYMNNPIAITARYWKNKSKNKEREEVT